MFQLSFAGLDWAKSCIALELARNSLHETAHTKGSNSQKEQCNLETQKAPREDRGVHNCPHAPIPKGLALGGTHRACKHFLASFVFSHSTSEPPLGHQVNLSLLMGQSRTHTLHPSAALTDTGTACCLWHWRARRGQSTGWGNTPAHPARAAHTHPGGRKGEGGWQRMGPCPDLCCRHEEGAEAAVLWLVTAGKCAMLGAAGRTGVLGHLLCPALFLMMVSGFLQGGVKLGSRS